MAVSRGPKPKGNGWIPIPGGWLNTVTGSMVQPAAGGGRTQTAPHTAPTAPSVRTTSHGVSAEGVNADSARYNALAAKYHRAAPRHTPHGPSGAGIGSDLSGRGPGGASRPNPADRKASKATAGVPDLQGGMGSFMGLLTALLGRAGTQKTLSTDLANAAAAPDYALADSLQSQLDRLPGAKAQALANIANWFGQVQSSEKKAAQSDQDMATAGAASLEDAAKGIAASLGGTAMAGSGQIGAVGANDANTLRAIGASDKQLASDLAPIFDLAKAGASDQTQGRFYQGKLNLEDQLGQAQGQATADKTAALMQILGANNQARQTNFANESGLLNTLASLQISGMNAATKQQQNAIDNAIKLAKLKQSQQKAVGGYGSMTPLQKQSLANGITQGLLDPSGKLSVADWPTALRNARNSVREAGFNPLDPSIIQQIIAPALANAGVQFANPRALYQP